MNITLYESKTAWPEQRHLAHMDLGKGVYASFFGKTEAEAKAKAEAWYASERERWARIDKSQEEAKTNNADEVIPNKGRGAHFVGMVWMINPAAEIGKQKIRVAEAEQKLWEGRGYKRGGARTQI